MSQPTESEIKRWAMDAADWLWGTAQGAWNEKQTTSQIIVDAVIGMIPLVGDATAVRDLLAVSTSLAENEKKREDVSEWVLLVVLLFALIPVIGGVIKGIGRLLIKTGKTAAKNSELIKDVVAILNRFGHGDAVKFIKELDLLKYQQELIDKFKSFIDTITDTLRKIKSQLGRLLSESMLITIDLWIERFGELKQAGSKMIPRALKDLNKKLKELQQAIYEAELTKGASGQKVITKETEARLVEENGEMVWKVTDALFPQNSMSMYESKKDWPDLRKIKNGEPITAFHGEIVADTIPAGKTIYRIPPPEGNVIGQYPAAKDKSGLWWTEKLPSNGSEFRKELAVLNSWNENGWYIKFVVPEPGLKVWRGRASTQINQKTGQLLPGGGEQLLVDFRHESNSSFKSHAESLTVHKTEWKDVSNVNFPPKSVAVVRLRDQVQEEK